MSYPRSLHLSFAAWAPGDGRQVIFDFGCPPVGNLWMVRLVTTYGHGDSDVGIPYTCSLYRGDPVNLNLATLIAGGIRVPATFLVSDTATYCHTRENLFLMTSGPVNSAQAIGANVNVEEWIEAEISRGDGS